MWALPGVGPGAGAGVAGISRYSSSAGSWCPGRLGGWAGVRCMALPIHVRGGEDRVAGMRPDAVRCGHACPVGHQVGMWDLGASWLGLGVGLARGRSGGGAVVSGITRDTRS